MAMVPLADRKTLHARSITMKVHTRVHRSSPRCASRFSLMEQLEARWLASATQHHWHIGSVAHPIAAVQRRYHAVAQPAAAPVKQIRYRHSSAAYWAAVAGAGPVNRPPAPVP